jgi:hypothetical protein
MIGRRAVIGLSLLSALLVCAFAAQSASAAKSANTTAVTCVKGEGKLDFKDAHCDEKVAVPGTGEYGHVDIAPTKGKPEETTKITFDNTTTGGVTDDAVLKGTAFGTNTEITCKKVHGEGGLHNVETESKKHTVTGTVTVKYTDCSVQKPAKCDVKEPIEFNAEFEGVDGLGPEKDTMGVEFKPDGGGTKFVSITYINLGAEKCALNEKTVSVDGTAIATGTPNPKEKHSGATVRFTDEMTTETLTFGGGKAGFDSIGTVKMIGGNPIALTTTT